MKAEMLLFTNLMFRRRLGGAELICVVWQFDFFSILKKNFHFFKLEFPSPAPPERLLNIKFAKSNISAFTGKKNYIFIFFCSKAKEKWNIVKNWCPWNFFTDDQNCKICWFFMLSTFLGVTFEQKNQNIIFFQWKL